MSINGVQLGRLTKFFYDGEPLTKLPAIYSKGEVCADVQRYRLEQDGSAAYLKLHDVKCATLKNFSIRISENLHCKGEFLCHEGPTFAAQYPLYATKAPTEETNKVHALQHMPETTEKKTTEKKTPRFELSQL